MTIEVQKATEEADVPIGEAAWDVVEAGHRVLLDRFDIFILEVRQAAVWAEQQAVLCLLAVLLLGTAWIALNCTAALAMHERLSWIAAGGLIAGANAVLGALLLGWAWNRKA